MPIEFDVKITANDMYRFNMYHIYTSFTGIFSILAAVLGFGLLSLEWFILGF